MHVWFGSTRRIAAVPLAVSCLVVAVAVALASVPAFAQHAPSHSGSHPSAPQSVPRAPTIRRPPSTATRVPPASQSASRSVSPAGSQASAGASRQATSGAPAAGSPVSGAPLGGQATTGPSGHGLAQPSAQPFVSGSAARAEGGPAAGQGSNGTPRTELPTAHYVGGGTPFGSGAARAVPHPPANRPWQRLPEGASAADRPPPGLCRVWLKGVPAARQPAPTSCGQAAKTRTPGSTLMFGDDGEAPRAPARPAEAGAAPPL
jgi:hypothetical protein